MKREGPDSVRSWLMVVTICFINTIFFGVRLTAFLFVDSITRYQVSRKSASFPYTFVVFTSHMSGPLVGWLAPKLGQRLTACLGCLLASLGAAFCFLAESIHVITVAWGVVFGLGNAFCLNMLPIFIIQYFDKQRGRASAISGLGMSLGAFLMSPMYEVLMENYGLSGTFLIFSGFLLNTIPAAMLLRKPNFIIKRTNQHSNKGTEVSQQVNSERGRSCEDTICSDTEDSSQVAKPTTVKQIPSGNACILTPKSNTFLTTEQSNCQVLNRQRPLPKHMDSVCKKRRNFKTFEIFKVLTDPFFMLILITASEHLFLLMCFSTILADFAKDIGIHESNLKYIPISSALGGIFGRICLGWVADKGLISLTGLSALTFFSQGILQLSICWSINVYMYLGILMSSAFFGTLFSILKPLIVDEFFKTDEQIMVISSSSSLAAPLSLCISPMIGYFRGHLGSYIYMFYTISAMQFVAGLLWLMAPIFIKCRRTQTKDPSSS